MTKKYQIEVTKSQAETIQAALEVFARLGIGQFHDALECLPLQDRPLPGWHDDLLLIGSILRKYTLGNVNGWQTSFGIHSGFVKEDAQSAWDLFQVIRKKLSWDHAIEMKWVEDEKDPRNWKEMMGVNFDDPMKVGPEPLAIIKKVEAE